MRRPAKSRPAFWCVLSKFGIAESPASIRTLCGAVCSGASWRPQFQRVLLSRNRTERPLLLDAYVSSRPRSHPNSTIGNQQNGLITLLFSSAPAVRAHFARVHRPLRSPTSDAARSPVSVPPQSQRPSSPFFRHARLTSDPRASGLYPARDSPECSALLVPTSSAGRRLLLW